MSLDIYLMQPPKPKCEHCGRGPDIETQVFSANITHNVTPMWNKAGVYDALYMSHGRKACEFIEVMRAGVRTFMADFAQFEKLDSPNGWGLAKNALPWLERVCDAFIAHPDAIIHVSK